MPIAARPSRPGTSTSPWPVLASPFQTAPVGIEPTYREVPRPAAIPSGCQPSGRRMVSGNVLAPAVAGTSAIDAITSRTSSRRTDGMEFIGSPLSRRRERPKRG